MLLTVRAPRHQLLRRLHHSDMAPPTLSPTPYLRRTPDDFGEMTRSQGISLPRYISNSYPKESSRLAH